MRAIQMSLILALVLAGCAGTAPEETRTPAAEANGQPRPAAEGPQQFGEIAVYLSDALGRDLSGKVELHGENGQFFTIDAPAGTGKDTLPAGEYMALVYIYSDGIPIVSHWQNVTLQEGDEEFILVQNLEGTVGTTPLWRFDRDFDRVIDRVEMELGTNPDDASDVPGRRRVRFESPTLNDEAGWYRGELYAHSNYHETQHGTGKQSVAQLVKRAEKLNLDFLAIADRNTLQSIRDPGWKSDKVVLLPAMEWGTEERGIALLYGPRTVPELVETQAEAQAVARMVQAQGGIVIAAHPALPNGTWQWGLGYINGVQVWYRGWREAPGIAPEALQPALLERNDDGKLIHAIARAASHTTLSANGQAARFWDYEMRRGLKASAYGGSGTASDAVPMAEPVTYVYAEEKSVDGILQGMWRGTTFVSSGLDGPVVRLTADVGNDGTNDIGMGGIIPIGLETKFIVEVYRGKGKKVEVLANGRTILSKIMEDDGHVHELLDRPSVYTAYRVRVVSTPEELGFGPLEVHALSSPIYAQEMYIESDDVSIHDMWVRLKSEYNAPTQPTPELDPRSKDATEIDPEFVF